MNILEVRNLTYKVPHKILCDGISFSLASGEKVALVAKNGAGKSTLLKLIAGELDIFDGTITILSRMRVGFLAQAEAFDQEATVLDTLFMHDSSIGQCIKQYETMLAQGETEGIEDLMQRIDDADARDYESRVHIVINKLQLGDLLEHKVGICSGGEVKRIALARLLIDDPDFLILDEPTNHLDVDMISWLETYLRKSTRTVLLVTHDRYFLERVSQRILELDMGDMYSYPGNYSLFLEMKAKREEDTETQRHELKQFLKRERERMHKAPRARATKSVKRSKDFHVHEKTFADMKRQSLDHKKRLDLGLVKRRIGGKVLRLHNVQKSRGEKVIVDNFTYDFRAGERVGLIGKNGVGKSTFIKMLAGEIEPDAGAVKKGKTIHIGTYQQQQRPLDPTKKVLDIVKDVAEYIAVPGNKRISASQMLERFMFPPRQQHQKSSTLSGGEQRRLSMLLTLLEQPNFLILDEPTNDLDIMTLGMLEDFLLSYPGCLLIISHDRMFMDRVVDHLFVFEGEGVISDFPGNYSEWEDAQLDKEEEQTSVDPEPVQSCVATQDIMQQQVAKKKSLSNKEREEYAWLGEEIERLEIRKEAINNELGTGTLDHKEIKILAAELAILAEKLETCEGRWLELAERG